MVKRLPTMLVTQVQSLGQEDPPGDGNGNPLQYSCLENPMDRGTWWATVHEVAKSRTRLSDFTTASVQQSDSAVHMSPYVFSYTYLSVQLHVYQFFFKFFSIIGYYKVSNVVPSPRTLLFIYFM